MEIDKNLKIKLPEAYHLLGALCHLLDARNTLIRSNNIVFLPELSDAEDIVRKILNRLLSERGIKPF